MATPTAGARSVVLPYWLDRPAEEAVDVAVAAERAGYPRLGVGDMAAFDAFARLDADAAAGADDVALVPSTAEDQAGAATLTALVGGAR
jgi:hypothetical protein